MFFDVKAASKFLAGRNMNRIVLVGASIGANVALNYGVSDPLVAGIVLLSPGLYYHSVRTVQAAESDTKPTFIVASEDDEYSLNSAKQLFEKIKSDKKEEHYYINAGHGTQMFDKEKLDVLIVDWMIRNSL